MAQLHEPQRQTEVAKREENRNAVSEKYIDHCSQNLMKTGFLLKLCSLEVITFLPMFVHWVTNQQTINSNSYLE